MKCIRYTTKEMNGIVIRASEAKAMAYVNSGQAVYVTRKEWKEKTRDPAIYDRMQKELKSFESIVEGR